MSLSRRELLARSVAGAAVVAVGDLTSLLRAGPTFAASGPGPLRPDRDGILDLPAGFHYSIVSRGGDRLPSGGVTPGRHDGTGTFRAGDRVRLVQNHEIGGTDPRPTVAGPELTYDPKAKGGTTTLTLDKHNRRIDEQVSLAGTWSNCAGGVTPWGTWLTCEETEQKAGPTADRDHGFVFEVDPSAAANNRTPTPLTGLGRFAHEAAVVDPQRGDVYLTEDASSPNGLVYRFRPSDTTAAYGALRNGGTLTAMRCSQGSTHVPDLSVFSTPGTRLQVAWVPVPDPLAATTSIRSQLTNGEVTRSRKFEGAWWGGTDRRAHIVCSFARASDGSAAEHDGQIWAYDPAAQTLTLEVRFAVNPDTGSDLPDGPDNITVSPFGGFFLAEDGNGVQHLLSVNDRGETSPFARNAMSESEFTGVVFSPDASTLFANIQDESLCFAITGPFERLRRG